MALTDEQRALLELVEGRGLSDEEVGELIGTGAADARRRVEEAVRARERERPRRRLLIGAGLGLGAMVAALALTGAFSGDDDEPVLPAETTPAEPEGSDQEIARIELSGVGGGGAQGSIAAGVGAANSPYLELGLSGLDPPAGDDLHMLWIEVESGRGLPLPEPLVVAADGSVRQRLELPAELAGILAVGRAIEVSKTDRAGLERVSREVGRAGARGRQGDIDPSSLPRRPGPAVLRGEIAAGL